MNVLKIYMENWKKKYHSNMFGFSIGIIGMFLVIIYQVIIG